MVSTTGTTVEMPQVRIVTAKDINRFCELTGDTNKAHKEENEGDIAAVPAFYIDWIVKSTFDGSQSPDYMFSRLDANFRAVLLRDEPFFIIPRATTTPDGAIQHEFQVVKGEVVVADGTIEYRLQREQPRKTHYDRQNPEAEKIEPYTMDQIVTEGVGQTLKLGDLSAAKLATAVSRTSNALIKMRPEDNTIPEKKRPIPFYGAHKLQVYGGIEEALSQQKFEIHARPEEKRKVDRVYVRGMSIPDKKEQEVAQDKPDAEKKPEAAPSKPFFDLTAIIFYLQPTP